MQSQWWQCKVINHLRFVCSVPEIGNIVIVWDVCLCNEQNIRRCNIQHCTDEANDAMGLWKMDTRCSNFFPQVRDGIQTNQLSTFGNIKKQCVDDFQKHIWVLKIEIDLISTERGPHPFRARGRFKLRQERQGTRSHHMREIRVAIYHNKVVAIIRIIPQEGPEPVMLNRGMINDRIEHQAEAAPKSGDILPTAKSRIDRPIINDRKTIVRRVWKKWQEVHTADQPRKMPFTKLS